jgi:hypothetical protein
MTTRSAPVKADTPPARIGVVWIGPHGHGSATFGKLVPGQTYYTDDPALARCLIDRNAAFWRAEAQAVEE